MKSRIVTIQTTAFDDHFPEVAFAFSYIPSEHCVKPGTHIHQVFNVSKGIFI